MPVRFGRSRAGRKVIATIASFLLVMSVAGIVSANVGTVTVSGQTPNPVTAGSTATYTVSFTNTSGTAQMFAATAVTGATGLSIVDGGCKSVPAGVTGNLTVKVGTTAATPLGTSNIRITVTEFTSTTVCSGTTINTNQNANNTATIVVRNPLAITYYKAVCPHYTDVPANANPGNADDTGGFWQELNTNYAAKPVDPTRDIPAACPTQSGWSFQFKDGQNGAVIDSYTTGAGGSVTVNLSNAELDLARGGGGLWLQEVTQPAIAGFGSIRCYNDVLNGDNLENMNNVPEATTQIYCVAYNVGGPGISLTKTADAATYVLGQTITYTYTVIDSSHVGTGNAQFLVSDNKVNGGTAFNCGAPSNLTPNTATLAAPSVGSFVACTVTHVANQADIDAGKIINTASARYTYGGNTYTSNDASVTVTGPTAAPSLSLTKTANPVVYARVGAAIAYTYVLTNSGNVTLTGPISVTDNKITAPNAVNCPATASLAPGASIQCTATYTTVAADLNAPHLVTNTATGHANWGITAVTTTAQATVNQATLTITANNQTKVYGAANPNLNFVTYSGFINGDTASSMGGTLTCTTTAGVNSAVGTYPITCSGLTNANYVLVWAPGTLTVTPKPLTITVNNNSKTYGATFATGTGSHAFTSAGLINGNTVTSITIASTGAPATAVVGTYPIVGSAAVGSGLGNYTITYVDGTLTVNPKALTVRAANQSKPYGTTMPTGPGQGPATFTTVGLINGDTVTSVTLNSTGAAAGAARGTYPIVPTAAVGTGVGNYTITYTNGTLTVGMGALTITAVNQTKIYGGTIPVGTGQGPTTFTVTGLAPGDTVTSVTLACPGAPATAAVGSYTITPSAAQGTGLAGNYTITYRTGTLTVNAKTLTITANDNSKVYGTALTFGAGSTAFTISGLTNTDTVTSVTLASTGAPATAGVGGYPIVPSTAVGTGLGNYTIAYANGTLTVNAKALTITANNNSKVYGTTMPTGPGQGPATFTTSGLINGDTVTSVTLSSTGAPATATVSGSPYSIVPSAAQGTGVGNYSITYTNGTLTVNAKALVITANDASKPYGTTFPTGAGQGSSTFSAPGLVNGDTVTSVTLACAGAPATAALGTYTITPSFAQGTGLGNYSISYANGNLTVGKGALTITANNGSKVYGTTFTTGGGSTAFTVSGLAGTDSVDTVTISSAGAPVTAGVAGSPYAIVPSLAQGTGLGNYNINYVNGNLTVTKATLTVTASNGTMVYGDTVPTIAPIYSGWVNGEGIAALSNPATCYPNATSTSPIGGAYTTDCAGLLAANYAPHYVLGTFSVTARPLTITANNNSKVYGTAVTLGAGSTAFTISGLVNSDTVTSATLSSTGAPATAAVGSYPIVATAAVGSGLGNYSISYVDGTLTVNAKALTITANDNSKVYGTALTLGAGSTAFTTAGLTNTDTVTSVTLASTGALATAGVGGYPIVATAAVGSGLGNYSISYVDGTLTVNAKALTITANDASKAYGTALTLGAGSTAFTTVGLVNSDTVTSVTLSSTGAPASATVSGSPYPIVPSLAVGSGLANYSITYTNGTLTVTTKALTITANDASKAYGTALTLGAGSTAFTTVGLTNSDTVTSVTLSSTGAPAIAGVGSYPIVPSVAVGSGLGNYSITYDNGTLTVGKANLIITASSDTMVYGGTVPPITPSYSGWVNGQGPADLTTPAICGPSATSPVGSYTTDCSGATSSTYAITYVAGTFSVTSAPLSITAKDQTKVYGANLVLGTTEFTQAGLVGSDSISGVTLTSSGSGVGAAVGPYPIVASAATGNGLGNYTITYKDGTLTVTNATLTITASDGTMVYGGTVPTIDPIYSGWVNGDGLSKITTLPTCAPSATSPVGSSYTTDCKDAVVPGYTIKYVPGTFSVTQAKLLITAPSPTRTYGAANGSLTPAFTGFVNSDTSASLTTQPNCTTTADPTSAPGAYPVTCTGAVDGNYQIGYADGTLTVTQAPLTITAPSPTRPYGASNPTLTPAFTGLMNGETSAALTTQPNCTTTATPASPNGNYPVTCSGAVDANYDINYVDGVLTVGRGSLTITASSGTMTYGGTVPTITPAFSGFVNGDTAATALTAQPTCTTDATSSSPVGTYATHCTGAASSTYGITNVDGIVTITAAPLTITASSATMIVGGSVPPISPLFGGFVNGDNEGTALTTTPTCATTATAASPIGTYDTTCSGAASDNYSITYVKGQVNVVAAPAPALTVIKTPSRTTYNAANQVITYSYALTNSGNVTLYGPFTVTDVPLGTVTCTGDTLAPGASLDTCGTKIYTTTQADLDTSKTITDTAQGHARVVPLIAPNGQVTPNARVGIDSNTVTVDVTASQGPSLSLVKAAVQTTFTKAGDVINYTYTLTNAGNVTLDGPFTVTDDKIPSVACPATPTSLAVGATITCNGNYTITLADLDAGKVMNTAVGHGRLGDSNVSSSAKVVTVTQQGLQTVLSETATPGPSATPPVTSAARGTTDGNSTPILAMLICLAFGALGLLAIQAQRRSIRR